MAQVTDGVTTTFTLDVAGGLPEVIYTSDNEVFLHLPGVIVTESSTGETRYLLSDGLGSIRHAVDESGSVVTYSEFDPYGNPIQHGSEPYGYTGEWWGSYIELLHLRARWYSPGTGTFLSVDPVGSEPPYQYVKGNPINWVDPSGLFSSDLIATSLRGRNVSQSFRGRYGLYWLLRDAKNNDRVDPLVVDFSGNWSVKYPLRNSVKSTTAEVRCENDRLQFSQGSSYGETLDQYLQRLEDAANQEPSGYWWRRETMELHYYRLIQPTGVTYYEDFGNMSYIPDYIGSYLSSSIDIGGFSRQGITDRYGNSYVVFSGGASVGLTGFGLADVEGYGLGHHMFPHNKAMIPSEHNIREGITGFGFAFEWIAGLGEGEGHPLVDNNLDKASFIQYSTGFDAGVSLHLTYGRQDGPKNEEKAWDWLDRINTGNRYPIYGGLVDPDSRLQPYSGNDCDCDSP